MGKYLDESGLQILTEWAKGEHEAIRGDVAALEDTVENLLREHDALRFRGTIGPDGGASPTRYEMFTRNDSWDAGDTYKVVVEFAPFTADGDAGTTAHIGDLLIATKDYDFHDTSHNNDNFSLKDYWTLVHTNEEGTAIAEGSLTDGSLLVGGGGGSVRAIGFHFPEIDLNRPQTYYDDKFLNGRGMWQKPFVSAATTDVAGGVKVGEVTESASASELANTGMAVAKVNIDKSGVAYVDVGGALAFSGVYNNTTNKIATEETVTAAVTAAVSGLSGSIGNLTAGLDALVDNVDGKYVSRVYEHGGQIKVTHTSFPEAFAMEPMSNEDINGIIGGN